MKHVQIFIKGNVINISDDTMNYCLLSCLIKFMLNVLNNSYIYINIIPLNIKVIDTMGRTSCPSIYKK